MKRPVLSVSAPVAADPGRIIEIATGFMSAQQLFAASRVGLFAAIGQGSRTAAELAEATHIPQETARLLADALAGLGVLTRDAGRYGLTPAASAYLTGKQAALDLSPYLTFLAEISYPHWLQFPATVATGKPGDLGMTDTRWQTFISGVMTYNRLHADMFAAALDFSPYRKLLDLGGLAPYFAIRAMQANAALTTTFVFAPDFEESLKAQLAEAGLTDRATVVATETPSAKPEGTFDLVFLNHVVHRFGVEQNRGILKNVRAAAAPGARLVVLDFYLDDDAAQRPLDALHAGEYLVIDGTVVFPESEVRAWLAEAGWRPLETIALPGSPRVILADAA